MRRAILLLVAMLLACRDPKHPGCPANTESDPARAQRIIGILAADPEAAALLQSKTISICLGRDAHGEVTTQGVLLLDQAMDDRALAARTAHLLDHLRRSADRAPGRSCDQVGSDARADESNARLLEQRVRERLGLPPEPLGDLDEIEREARSRCEAMLKDSGLLR